MGDPRLCFVTKATSNRIWMLMVTEPESEAGTDTMGLICISTVVSRGQHFDGRVVHISAQILG